MEHRQSAPHNEPRNEAQFSIDRGLSAPGTTLSARVRRQASLAARVVALLYRGADGRIIRRDQGSAAARTPGDTSRYQRRHRLCDGSAVGKRRGTGDDPARSCRRRPDRYTWWPSIFHARDDSHHPRLARANRHVRGARRKQGGQRRHLPDLRIARRRDGARHASRRRNPIALTTPGLPGSPARRSHPNRKEIGARSGPLGKRSTTPWPTSGRWPSCEDAMPTGRRRR